MKKVADLVTPEYRAFLMEKLSMAEELLLQTKKGTPKHKSMVRGLTMMYGALNRQLGMMAKELNYKQDQWTWRDSRPLEKLAKLYPGLAGTDWYQRQLGMIIMPVDHPWYRIPKFAEPVNEGEE